MELNIDEWDVEGFLIVRNNNKNTAPEDYLTIKKINISDPLKIQFKKILSKRVCDEDNNFTLNLDEFSNFMDDDSKDKNYKISSDELNAQNNLFQNLLEKINEEEHDLATNDFSKYYTVIIRFSKESQEFFYFRKLYRVRTGKKRFSIHEGNVEELVKDFIYFDEWIDFIFFKNFIADGSIATMQQRFNNQVLIFNRKNFKTLFRLHEYCIEKSQKFFEDFNFIKVADVSTGKEDKEGNDIKLQDSFIHDGVLNTQITRVFVQSRDQITFDKLKNIKDELGNKVKYGIDGDSIVIEDKEQMKDLLDLVDEKIATPRWNTQKDLRFHSKGESLD